MELIQSWWKKWKYRMRIFLATCGSRSDVQPMLSLCLALQSSGRDVILAGSPEKKVWAKILGYPNTSIE